jgi:two-component system sensor histidine kinase VicK
MENISREFSAIQQIGDVSAEGVIIYDLAHKKIIYANSRVHDILGLNLDSSQVEVEAILDLVAPQDREYLKNQYSTVAEKPITEEVEFQLTSLNKKQIFLCCNAFLVSNKSAVVVFIKDVTRPKEHENYIVEYGARKNTLLDTLAHQISGALNLMQHLSGEAEKYIESTNDKNLKIYLDLLNDNCSHCLEIIYDLLKVEHVESASVPIKNSRIDIIEKVSFIHDELAQSYRNRKFIFQTSSESLHINTDEVKFLQVVNNLTSNAIKFSPVGKTITIGIADTGTEVIVSVKDEGIGIPEKLKPLIFQTQFGRGRTGLNGQRSIGLGLSICINLTQLMNGKIWFDSEEGKGSTFYFSVPKA